MFSLLKTPAEEAKEENSEERATILKEFEIEEARKAEDELRKEEEAGIE